MEHPLAFRAVVDGKPPVNNINSAIEFIAHARRLLIAAAVFFVASGSAGYAQSGAFAGLAGVWSGGGTITLDDGSTERIRCRATYAVSGDGNGLNQSLTCASDSYKFILAGNVIARGGVLSGTWSEQTRNLSGSLEGRSSPGQFNVVASSPGFSANISLRTQGNKQAVSITSQSVLRAATISLTRS
jgi:hypothetical protein